MRVLKTFETFTDKSSIRVLTLTYRDLPELSDLSEYTNLTDLYCENNQLTSLPELPESLKIIYCGYNKLKTLPKLPKNIKKLYCNGNQLTSLPELPKTLKELYCENNQLTSLPELPEKLIFLNCSNTGLPFEDLYGYEKWYEQNKDIIETEGLEYAYEFYNQINKYNI